MSWLVAVADWLWFNTAGNLVASLICVVVGYFWKIRPHLRRQAEHRQAAEDRHEQIEGWLAGIHERFDELANPPAGRHADPFPPAAGELPRGGEVECE